MSLVQFCMKNLLRRPARSVLTVFGLALAIAAVVSLVGVVRGYRRSMLDLYRSHGVDVVVFRAAGPARASLVLDESLGPAIRRLPGVRAVSASLADTVSFEQYGLYAVVLQGLPLDSFLLENKRLLHGRQLKPGDRRVVMLGKVIADNLGKGAGDTLELIEGEPFRVVGVFQSFSFLENSMILAPIDQLQRIFQREHQVTGYVVSSQQQNRESIDRLCREIRRLSRLADAQPTREFFDTAIEARLAQAMAWLTSAVALIVGSIGMLNTMWMGVVERTQEIAALRAIGWRRWSVMRLVLLESMLLAASGAVLGTLAAIGLTWLLSRHPAVQNLVSSSTDPLTIVQALAIATAICALGGAYPAYRASQLAPAEGLRHE